MAKKYTYEMQYYSILSVIDVMNYPSYGKYRTLLVQRINIYYLSIAASRVPRRACFKNKDLLKFGTNRLILFYGSSPYL